MKGDCSDCTYIVIFILGVFGISLVFVLVALKHHKLSSAGTKNTNEPLLSSTTPQPYHPKIQKQSIPHEQHFQHFQHFQQPHSQWQAVGKVSHTKRAFILMAMKHPTRRHRFLYHARSTDLFSQTEFVLCRNGTDITSERGLGSDELRTSDTVHMPEISTNAQVFISHDIC